MDISRNRGGAPVTCLIAEDHLALRDAVETLLTDDGIDVLGTARTGVEALQLLEEQPVTLLVLDLRLPDMSGVEVARRAIEIARKKTAVLIYTSYANEKIVAEALDSGAHGVVLKDASPASLLEAIQAVAANEIYVDPKLRSTKADRSS